MTAPAYKAIPRTLSPTPPEQDISRAHRGAAYLGMPLLPQGVQVAQVLDALDEDGLPLYSDAVVQIPRRSTKTTSVQSVLLGRCFEISGYRVVSTAQTQAIARRVFIDMIYTLEAKYPDPETRPFKARVGNGQEDIRWDNGSVWWIVAPRASAFRSQAADCIWLDEGGEYSLEQTSDLVEGVYPLMDTRPQGQIIVSGTPSARREGLLWEALSAARKDPSEAGIIDYSMAPGDDPTSEAVWWKVHAGLASGLTTIKTIRKRFEKMALASFMREYLCADPSAASLAAINQEDWTATQVDGLLPIPATGYTLAFDVHPDGSSAALSASWFTDDGTPVIQLIEYRAGFSWLPRELSKLMKADPRVPVIFDRIGNNVAVFTELQRIPGLRLASLQAIGAKEVSAGVSLMMSALTDRNLIHAKDRDLDAAADGANFRYVNDARLFGRRTSTEDTAPIVAAANALWHISGQRKRTPYVQKKSLISG